MGVEVVVLLSSMLMETEAEETQVLDLVQGCWLGDFLVMVLVEDLVMDLDLVEVLVMVVLVEVLVMGDLEDITTMKQQPLKLQKPITLLSTTTITQSLLLKTYLVVFPRTT